jgi:DNA-binding NtrC family response regulator
VSRTRPPPTFSPESLDTLRRAPWRGNVRELRNVIEHLVVLATPGAVLAPEDIVFIDDDAASWGTGLGFRSVATSLDYHLARDQVLARFEVDYLTHVVQSCGGNISDAARMAGVDRTTLYRLMDKHGIGRDGVMQTDAAVGARD